MASIEFTKHIVRTIFGHELFMKNNYEAQLQKIAPGVVRDRLEGILSDEKKHCSIFEETLHELDTDWVPQDLIQTRTWTIENNNDLREALEFDLHMEEELEKEYMTHLTGNELTLKAKENIDKVLAETRGHASTLKQLLSTM